MTWLPGYEQVPILGCTGPGSYVSGYPWRIVLHTTESPFGSAAGIINFFRGQPCSTPHFMLDPGTRRKTQFIPIDYSAAALRGGQAGYETNRGHAIQVEICGRADDAADWPDDVLAFIGGWIADVVNAGYPINLNNVTGNDYRGTVATASSPYRMSWPAWKNFDGVCGHIDVPGNDHYDPYKLDKARVVEHAKARLGRPGIPQGDWFDMATRDDLKAAIREVLAEDEVKSGLALKNKQALDGTLRVQAEQAGQDSPWRQGQDLLSTRDDINTVVLDQLDPRRGTGNRPNPDAKPARDFIERIPEP